MPGRFTVRGSFVLGARNRLIVYGDVVKGTIEAGEELVVPLNSSLAMTVPIESVEAVDGTETGSHVALVVAEDDPLGHDLIHGLNITGETLAVQKPVHPVPEGHRQRRSDNRLAARFGVIGSAIALLLVVVDTLKVERHDAAVLGHREWPDLSSALGIVVFAVAAMAVGFGLVFVVTRFGLILRPWFGVERQRSG